VHKSSILLDQMQSTVWIPIDIFRVVY